MTKRQINRFSQMLEAKRAELHKSLHAMRGRLAIDQRGDNLDRGRKVAERDVAMQSMDLESELLRRVEGALQEIQDGTFGVCAECDGPIPITRLNAVPWSPFCIACQEAAEAGSGPGPSAPDEEPRYHAR